MKLNRKQFNRWLIALYQEEYPQTTEGALKDKTGYCCLGVGCVLFIPRKKIVFEDKEETIIWGALPDDQKHSPKWLVDINSDFNDISGFALSVLNDVGFSWESFDVGEFQNEPFTHAEIAILLDLVYNYKILN